MAQRILVVDDDRQITRLLSSYLEKAGMTVLTAYDGENALRIIRHERPDLVVLDLMLPGLDGFEITRTLRADERLAAIPILMLTARVEDTDKILGLELGADDYITKPFNPREIVARVRAILRRSGSVRPVSRVLELGDIQMDPDRHIVRSEGKTVDMTPTEFQILRALMENPGHAFTRGELIEQALGYAYEGMERTLDSHIKNLRKKIGAEHIETVVGIGYRFQDGELDQ